ncbi:MAG: hypothetical protein DWQ34_10395 [Planctomycetota bacterium]|nr:MAG: hypothetical protein DWQ29_21670 [Planctomycetota bacterium]REJ93553.1 MAG: hypothetical protein DWQ34_10395 [Planctomycetota bacterium]REK21446.1 MAG: hypothetical protein DWQ41_21690 [Planctomycetota bacterium]REK40042.1 MAG: hypothetical protein DWQ45_00355 [Planctomycetota bacterium]
MATAATSFAELHRLHLALREVQQQLDRGPRQIRAREQLAAQAEADVAAKREELKTLRAAGERKSLELKTNEAKIEELKGKLNAAASNREYDIIRGQIDADTVANSVLQDEILEQLEKVDRVEKEIKEAEAEVEQKRAAATGFRERFEADSVGLSEQAEKLQAEIRGIESGLGGQVTEKYRRLVAAHGADALAPVENSVCGYCHVQITRQKQVQLNAGQVVFCSNCARLLYVSGK